MIIFLDLSYDPGTRHIGQGLVSIKENLDTNIDTNYQFEHVKIIDCIGKDGVKKSETGKILDNLNKHLSTDKTVQEFIRLSQDPRYNTEVTIESQEGLTNSHGNKFFLAVAMIQMGTISGAIYEFFASKGIKVTFVHKKAKWGYTQNTKIPKKPNKKGTKNQKSPKKVIINKKASNNNPICLTKTNNGGVKKPQTKKPNNLSHKINTKKIVLDILSRQDTKKSQRVTRWFTRNKKEAQHAQDSLLAAMKRLQQRISEYKKTKPVPI